MYYHTNKKNKEEQPFSEQLRDFVLSIFVALGFIFVVYLGGQIYIDYCLSRGPVHIEACPVVYRSYNMGYYFRISHLDRGEEREKNYKCSEEFWLGLRAGDSVEFVVSDAHPDMRRMKREK